MALYNAYLYDAKTRTEKPLGRVQGRNQPAAVLRAFEKFKVPAGQMRMVGVRRVKPLPPPPPLPESEVAELRKISQAFNRVLKGTV